MSFIKFKDLKDLKKEKLKMRLRKKGEIDTQAWRTNIHKRCTPIPPKTFKDILTFDLRKLKLRNIPELTQIFTQNIVGLRFYEQKQDLKSK